MPGPVRFAVIGANHGHIYGQTDLLRRAGAELTGFFIAEDDLAAEFGRRYPDARRVGDERAILEDPRIQLVVSAAVSSERGPLGVAAMRHGKDYMSDKPAFTTLEQLAAARRAQAETGRIFSVCFSERFENPSTVRAGELVAAGAIGKVVHTMGLGPHRIDVAAPTSVVLRAGAVRRDSHRHRLPPGGSVSLLHRIHHRGGHGRRGRQLEVSRVARARRLRRHDAAGERRDRLRAGGLVHARRPEHVGGRASRDPGNRGLHRASQVRGHRRTCRAGVTCSWWTGPACDTSTRRHPRCRRPSPPSRRSTRRRSPRRR